MESEAMDELSKDFSNNLNLRPDHSSTTSGASSTPSPTRSSSGEPSTPPPTHSGSEATVPSPTSPGTPTTPSPTRSSSGEPSTPPPTHSGSEATVPSPTSPGTPTTPSPTHSGKLSEGHEWRCKYPEATASKAEKVLDIVKIKQSAKYVYSKRWLAGDQIKLSIIAKDVRGFVEDFGQKSSPYKELKLYHRLSLDLIKSDKAPYWNEIGYRKDHKSTRSDQETFEAHQLHLPSSSDTCLLDTGRMDCEYFLQVSTPKHLNKTRVLLTSNRASAKDDHDRWIFIPSFQRANSGLFDWDHTGDFGDTTHRVLVVRPCQFEDYKKSCGHILPIISLPHDEIGIGYARHWILKIAIRMGLKFIWMLDDDIKWFREYNPSATSPKQKHGQNLCFESVFTAVENLVKSLGDEKKYLAAISPYRYNGQISPQQPFAYKPPQAVVYLNVEEIKNKGIQYRPELAYMEDMVFAAECLKQGMIVCRWNRIAVYDVKWKGTGATSPFMTKPQAQAPAAAAAPPVDGNSTTPQRGIRNGAKPKQLARKQKQSPVDDST